MAEAVALAASIAGLISLGLEVSRHIYSVKSAFGDPPTSIRSVCDELEGTLTVLGELRNCLSAASSSLALSQVLRESNLTVLIHEIEGRLTSLKTGLEKFGILGAKRSKKWQRWRLVLLEKEMQRHLGSLQRQKLMLIFALSCLALYVHHRRTLRLQLIAFSSVKAIFNFMK